MNVMNQKNRVSGVLQRTVGSKIPLRTIKRFHEGLSGTITSPDAEARIKIDVEGRMISSERLTDGRISKKKKKVRLFIGKIVSAPSKSKLIELISS